MNIRRRLQKLEAALLQTDDQRLLAALYNALASDEQAHPELKRLCPVEQGNRGLLNIAELYLHGPAADPDTTAQNG